MVYPNCALDFVVLPRCLRRDRTIVELGTSGGGLVSAHLLSTHFETFTQIYYLFRVQQQRQQIGNSAVPVFYSEPNDTRRPIELRTLF